MNPEDVLARVQMTTHGMALSGKGRTSVSAAIHNDLVKTLRSRHPTPRGLATGERLRRALLRRINEHARVVKRRVLDRMNELRESGCVYEGEVAYDGQVSGAVAFDSPPNIDVLLQLLPSLMALEAFGAKDQLNISAIYRLEDQLALDRAESGLPTAEERATEKRLRQLRKELPGDLSAWLRSNPINRPPGWERPLPVEIPPTAQHSQLVQAADSYREFGFMLVKPMPLDSSVPPEKLEGWERLWKNVEDLGDAMVLLAHWMRCIDDAEGAKLCKTCYRHVDRISGLRLMCPEHNRLNQNAPDARQQNISGIYHRLVELFFSRKPGLSSLLVAEPTPKPAPLRLFERLDAHNLPDPLLKPGRRLAELVGSLLPFVPQTSQHSLEVHFSRVLEAAKAGFADDAVKDPIKRQMLRSEATDWLGWEAFLRTWFGPQSNEDYLPARPICLGHDPWHPVVEGFVPTFSQATTDLLRQLIWDVVETRFDQSVYVSVQELRRFLEALPKLSLQQIASSVGVSTETVRKARSWINDPDARAQRVRIIPKRARLFEERLSLELVGPQAAV